MHHLLQGLIPYLLSNMLWFHSLRSSTQSSQPLPNTTRRNWSKAPSCLLFILSWSFIRINSLLSLLQQLSINMKWIKIGKLTVYLKSVEHEIITNIKEWERFISNKIHIEIIIFFSPHLLSRNQKKREIFILTKRLF